MRQESKFDQYRTLLGQELPDLKLESFRYLADGMDHILFEVNGFLIFRFRKDRQGSHLARESQILEAVRKISTLPTPLVVYDRAQAGFIAYPKLIGQALVDQPLPLDLDAWPDLVPTLNRFLKALHAANLQPRPDFLGQDWAPPLDWLIEARKSFSVVQTMVPPEFHPSIRRFLDDVVTWPKPRLVLAHNDFGAEHILVDPVSHQVTAVLDWGDTALADPAVDLAKLYRDLGPAVLEGLLKIYPPKPEIPELGAIAALETRVRFYARCGLLEDLKYGLDTGRRWYIDKSLRALGWTF